MAVARLVVRMPATIIGASAFTFFLIEISIRGGFAAVVLPPGDRTSPRARRLIDLYHLDENPIIRYGHWLWDAVRGDFGQSAWSDESVVDILTHRLPITAELMLVAVVLTIVVGVPLGLLSVAWRDRRIGRVLDAALSITQSIPIYVSPLFLIAWLAVGLRWLPASGWTRISDSFTGNLRGLALPVLALTLAEVGPVARLVRANVVRELEMDYVTAAIGKGLSPRYVLFRHTLRPASLGLLELLALNIGSLLSGAVVVEIIFGIGGLGQVLVGASLTRDLPLLLGLTTYAVVVHVGLSTIVDAVMLSVDPRIRRRAG